MSCLFYDVDVGVATLELMPSMLQPCSDVATKNMLRHISEMVS